MITPRAKYPFGAGVNLVCNVRYTGVMLARAKSFVERNERRLSTASFVLGFIWDNLTLTRIDRLFDNIILASYLVVAFGSIVLLNAHATGRLFQGSFSRRGVGLARLLLPFAFGGLFSGFLIFYSRSGSVVSSAPFLLLLATLFLGNELFRRHYQRFIFQMSVFFVTLFSYSALIIPVLLGKMGGFVFVVSGLSALFIFFLALRAVSLVAREEVEQSRHPLWVIVVIIFVTFNVLYFNNMIPPIPLSLKEIGVYHDVSRTRSGEYKLVFEEAPWYAFGKKTSGTFHLKAGEPVYAFSSIFAPTSLDTEIQHRWSYFDEGTGEWVSTGIVGFPISGGRNEGYRGYSVRETIAPGKWRVDVETLRGQIIGRFDFTVVQGGASSPLKTEIK
ncbi:MAG: DUF2914 domain-containing protein [bacterium]|nr:DUF2914 domain-containing protein [bacterium]